MSETQLRQDKYGCYYTVEVPDEEVQVELIKPPEKVEVPNATPGKRRNT